LIAAIVALTAGTMAYRAAMAKVRADEKIVAQTLARKKRGLFLRLVFALDRLREEARGQLALTAESKFNRTITLRQMRTAMPPELDEAWMNLDLFLRAFVDELAMIRTNVQDLRNLHDQEKNEEFVINSDGSPRPEVVRATHNILAKMESHCIDAERLLEKEPELIEVLMRRDQERASSYAGK